jgi:hypothetical protein
MGWHGGVLCRLHVEIWRMGGGGIAPGVRPFRFGCAAAAMGRDMIINVSSSFEIFERGPMLTLSLGLDIGPGGGSFVIWGSLGAGSAETLFLFTV